MNFLRFLWRRTIQKISALAALVIPALLFSLVLALLLRLVVPLLPELWLEKIRLVTSGDMKTTATAIRDALGSDWRGAALFMALQTLQVLLAPIPGQIVAFAGGWIFGFWPGLVITMTGVTLGSWLAMAMVRQWGRKVLHRLVPPSLLQRFDYLLEGNSPGAFFAIFLFPALPDDALCFVAGLTKIKLSTLLVVSFLGRLPGFAVLSFAGSRLGDPSPLGWAVFVTGIVAGLACWLFSEELEAFFANLIRRSSPQK